MQVEITELFRQIAGDAPVIQALVGGIIIALLILGASLGWSGATLPSGRSTPCSGSPRG
jgi:hypothetical protein